MTMRSSDATFLRREILPILDRAASISPEAKAAHDRLTERLEAECTDPTPPVFEVFRTMTTGQPIRVAVDGIGLPYIEAWIRTLEDGEEVIDLLLDGRMGIVTRESELARWAWFLANAMAVAGGRTCHGPVSYLRNPHGMSGGGGPQG